MKRSASPIALAHGETGIAGAGVVRHAAHATGERDSHTRTTGHKAGATHA
jgi:hypothetical protein